MPELLPAAIRLVKEKKKNNPQDKVEHDSSNIFSVFCFLQCRPVLGLSAQLFCPILFTGSVLQSVSAT